MAVFYKYDGYEKKSQDFDVFSGEAELEVLSCTVSAHPLNQVWPGYQRPREQTEQSAYLSLSEYSLLFRGINGMARLLQPFSHASVNHF